MAEQLTKGLLDGLHIQTVSEDDKLTHLHFTIDTLPGLRLIMQAPAARELHEALGIIFSRFK